MIKKDLSKLQDIWDYHQCASSSYKSPHRMWIEGQIRRPLQTHPAVNEFVDDDFAVDNSIEPIELEEPENIEDQIAEEVRELESNDEIFRPPLSEESMQWLHSMYIPIEPYEDIQRAIEAYAALRAALVVLLEEQNSDIATGMSRNL